MRRRGRRSSILIALVALSQLMLGAAGWREPTASEIGQEWREESPHRYANVSADFDGDGRVDRGRLMVATDGRRAALVVELAASPAQSMVLDEFDNVARLDVMGIDLVRPGKYRTACGKGYWACQPGEPEELTLVRPAIDYFQFQSANSYFIYDRDAGRFQRVWMSD